jgi:transcription elongation factor GreA
MSNETKYLTPDGAAKLRAELEYLTNTERDSIAKRLRDAIEMGDLSENADYHKAKEDQGFLEGRIQDLQSLLISAVIIEQKQGAQEIVDIGTVVTVQEGREVVETYQIVGAKEADPKNGRISNESPMGRALMGKRVGTEARVASPDGEIIFQILGIGSA